MKVQLRPRTFKLRRGRPRYIVIHDCSCMFHNIDQIRIDKRKSQSNTIRKYNWILNGQADVNYHYIIERIGIEHETIVGRPLDRLCEYPDIPDQYIRRGIHIALMGLMDYHNPTPRYYEQIAYRVIAPFMSMFGIPVSNIYLHSEISNDKDVKCPGFMFSKDKLLAFSKRMRSV